MRTVNYTPSVCAEQFELDAEGNKIPDKTAGKGKFKVIPATFSGHVVMRVPSFDERYEEMEAAGINVDAKGEVVMENKSSFAMLRKMVKSSEKFYQEVQLKRLADGKEFKSLEDLQHDSACDKILVEIAQKCQTGFPPGKQ